MCTMCETNRNGRNHSRWLGERVHEQWYVWLRAMFARWLFNYLALSFWFNGNQSIGSSQSVMRCAKDVFEGNNFNWKRQYLYCYTIDAREKKGQNLWRRWLSLTPASGEQKNICQSTGSNLIDRIYWSNAKSNYDCMRLRGNLARLRVAPRLHAHSLNAIEKWRSFASELEHIVCVCAFGAQMCVPLIRIELCTI